MVSEDIIKPQTLEPGMACKCGPAMRAAIMERAKELGLWDECSLNYEADHIVGLRVVNGPGSPCYGKVAYFSISLNAEIIPTPEFLRRLENTKPPKRELTTEEKLAEAVRLLDRVTTWHENLMKACGHYTMLEDFTHTGAARAFLKTIKP